MRIRKVTQYRVRTLLLFVLVAALGLRWMLDGEIFFRREAIVLSKSVTYADGRSESWQARSFLTRHRFIPNRVRLVALQFLVDPKIRSAKQSVGAELPIASDIDRSTGFDWNCSNGKCMVSVTNNSKLVIVESFPCSIHSAMFDGSGDVSAVNVTSEGQRGLIHVDFTEKAFVNRRPITFNWHTFNRFAEDNSVTSWSVNDLEDWLSKNSR